MSLFIYRTSAETEMLRMFFSDHYLLSWLSAYEFYNENYLSCLTSNKWSILLDPHGLALAFLRAQNPSLLVIDYHDKSEKK